MNNDGEDVRQPEPDPPVCDTCGDELSEEDRWYRERECAGCRRERAYLDDCERRVDMDRDEKLIERRAGDAG